MHCLEMDYSILQMRKHLLQKLRVFFTFPESVFSIIVFNFFFLGIHSLHELFCFLNEKMFLHTKNNIDM